MYAVIASGGKQYKVSEGDIIEVERIEANVGEEIKLDVLLKVDGETVEPVATTASAKVLSHGKAKKIIVYKYKAKKNERRKQGHRQPFTRLQITQI